MAAPHLSAVSNAANRAGYRVAGHQQATRQRRQLTTGLVTLAGLSAYGVAAAGKECLRIDEADRVPEGVTAVEAPLAPRLNLDLAKVSTSGCSCSSVRLVQVFNTEVEVLRIRGKACGIAVSRRVVAREDRAPGVEGAAGSSRPGSYAWPKMRCAVEACVARGAPSTVDRDILEQRPVERRSRLEPAHRQAGTRTTAASPPAQPTRGRWRIVAQCRLTGTAACRLAISSTTAWRSPARSSSTGSGLPFTIPSKNVFRSS